MSNTQLSDEQRFALAALIQFHLIRCNKKGKAPTHRQLGLDAGLSACVEGDERSEADTSLTDKRQAKKWDEERASKVGSLVNNVLTSASAKGTELLKIHYEKLLKAGNSDFDTPPRHIKVAIDTLFPPVQDAQPMADAPTKTNKSDFYSLQSVFSRIRHTDKIDQEILGNNYKGKWD